MNRESNGKQSTKKKSSATAPRALRSVVGNAVSTDSLIDLVERLGLIDLVIGRVKSRIEETDVDELFDDIADYMRRNPEVLVVSLGALTVATGLLVWLNERREWEGTPERRGTGQRQTITSARARAKKAS